MSAYENPNPSAFRTPNFAIDLSQVVLIVRNPRDLTIVHFLLRGQPADPNYMEWPCVRVADDESCQRLLSAFETYHSKR